MFDLSFKKQSSQRIKACQIPNKEAVIRSWIAGLQAGK